MSPMTCWDCVALNEVANQRSGQDGVFAKVLEGAPVARLAGEVHAAAEGHVVALRAQFACRSARRSRRLHSGSQLAAAPRSRAGQSSSGHWRRWSALRRLRRSYRCRECRAAARRPHSRRRGWRACSPTVRGSSVGMPTPCSSGDLLVERHLFDDQVGALVGPVGLDGCPRCEKPGTANMTTTGERERRNRESGAKLRMFH
jgi:hypothetical protein